MENLNKENAIKFEMKGANDVTGEIIPRIGKSYVDAVKRVMQNGRLYLVELNKDYTAFGETSRLARRVPEVGYIARIATEEKANGYDTEHYIKEFKQNGIAFDGKTIPQFIDTIEDVKAKAEKEAEKEAKKAEKETKTKTENK
jgi:hypothetical protein